jgi:AcrR family transcriptional regulator
MDIDNHAPGRPRSQDVDAAILKAAVELLAKKGPNGLTINAVARRSRVARASIYLRYPGREALLAATLRRAIGRDPIPLTGDLEKDLREGAVQAQTILATASFRNVLPELVRGWLRQPDGENAISFDLVAPQMPRLADEYGRLAERSGFRADLDPALPGMMIVGTLLLSLVIDGVPATPEAAAEMVEVVLAGLKAPGEGAT